MKKSSFFKKIKFKYKLSILNENTLEELSHIRLSLLNVFLLTFFVAVMYFFMIAYLIIKTPLRGFLPGYTENISLRKQVLLDAVQIDSLLHVVNEQTEYVQMLRKVMANDVQVDSTSNIKLLTEQERAKCSVEASDKEKEFREEYEESQKKEPKSHDKQDLNYLMTKPTLGVVTSKYDPSSGRNGIVVMTDRKSSVHAIMDGIVIFSGYSPDNYYVLQIQHVDNLISIYTIKQPFLKKVGDNVQGGEILATFLDEAAEYEVKFELWKMGRPLDPETFMTFN
ncbi:MAG TPA: M23 family metallopeptidase [Paludibacteraceae bacterium]|jgi:lipoprotein NlpD|nr:M23 family metallopeptidase [Paludibacteraceae bacterium]